MRSFLYIFSKYFDSAGDKWELLLRRGARRRAGEPGQYWERGVQQPLHLRTAGRDPAAGEVRLEPTRPALLCLLVTLDFYTLQVMFSISKLKQWRLVCDQFLLFTFKAASAFLCLLSISMEIQMIFVEGFVRLFNSILPTKMLWMNYL